MKLTNYLREQLLARVRKHAFEKRQDDHARALRVFGIKVLREHAITAKDLRLIDSLPFGICPTVTTVSFRLGGDFHTQGLGDRFRAPAQLVGNSTTPCVLTIEEHDNPLVVEWRELKAVETALKDELKSVMTEVSAVLESCSTVKQLLTTWPEIKDLAGDLLLPPAKPQPLVVGNLNAKVGLPV